LQQNCKGRALQIQQPANCVAIYFSKTFMEYNTTRSSLAMREYGRHVQKMIDQLLTIEDPKKRQKNAEAVIELMGFLNPHLRSVEDYRHKLWDHLFFISDFKLDIESPYTIPTRETLKTRPKPLAYPSRSSKLAHLGKNLEDVINKALEEQDPEKKQGFANAIAYYMKLAYNNWHKEVVHDDAIQSELSDITGGQLAFTNTPHVKSYSMKADMARERNGFGKQRNKFQSRNGNGNNNNSGNRRTKSNGNSGNNFKKKRF
jgi:hypothetical protein